MNVRSIIEFFVPKVQRCLVCAEGTAIEDYGTVCERCLRSAPWIVHHECSICGRPVHCPDCPRRAKTFYAIQRSAVSYTAEMKQWLGEYKYSGDERYARALSWMMLAGVSQLIEAIYGTYTKNAFDLVTFVPIDPHRLAVRGFNQSEQLARWIAEQLHLPLQSTLRKIQNTAQQSKMSRVERVQHLKGAFVAEEQWVKRLNRKPLRILLVDDVYTTGSTLNECARILTKTSPCRVYGLTWARS